MNPKLEVLFAPAEFQLLAKRDLKQTVCVVFDVLRASSSIVTALGNGADAVMPVEEISEALKLKIQQPDVLLAGERHGVRIDASLTGGLGFDLGNSPREFSADKVRGKRIVTTTTNGTRALRACAHARTVLVSSFLNLKATADFLHHESPAELLLVCSGTFEECAYEDVLGAGALCAAVWERNEKGASDSARIAHLLWDKDKKNLAAALAQTRNGRRLLDRSELKDDVRFCAQQDIFDFTAELGADGWIRRIGRS